MAKEEVLKAAEEVLRAGDAYSLDWGLEKLSKIIKKNMIYSFNLKRNKNNYIFKSCEIKTM